MADLMIRFFLCNLLLSGIIGILSAVKRLLKNTLSGKMQYDLWFLLPGFLLFRRQHMQLQLYRRCLEELNITKEIPIYSAAFLKSPIITGFLKPCIYLPIHLLSNHPAWGTRYGSNLHFPEIVELRPIRYMLLHELQHYKRKDTLSNHLMNLAGIVYWFNPVVWFALREMRNDREIACDTSVLKLLEEDSYEDYGQTLLNLAEKYLSRLFSSSYDDRPEESITGWRITVRSFSSAALRGSLR